MVPDEQPSRRVAHPAWVVITALLGVGLVAYGWIGLSAAKATTDATSSVVDGVPVTLVKPADGDPATASPSAIVAHGFAGSRALMDGFATALADSGFVVALLDFTGHGANPEPLIIPPDGARDNAALQADLNRVAQWLADQPGVSDQPPVVIGHSMGAGAVVDYAIANPDAVSGTIAVSLPSAENIPTGEPATPRNLLLLWGVAEQARFSEAALTALTAGYPDAVPGSTYGDFAAGTARAAIEVPGAEHLSILWRSQTLQAVVSWSADATGTGAVTPAADTRMAATAACAVGTVILLIPLATLVLGNHRWPTPRTVPWVLAMGILLVGVVAGAAAGRFVDTSSTTIPLATGGYLAVFFLAVAVVAGVAGLMFGRRTSEPGVAERLPILGTLLLAAVMTAGIAIPGRQSWAPFAFVGDRIWLAVFFVIVFTAWLTADEIVIRRASRVGRALVLAYSRVVVIAGLLVAVFALDAPGFLTLLVPLMVPLFALLGFTSVIVAARTSSVLPPVAVQAVPLGLLVATTFPLIG